MIKSGSPRILLLIETNRHFGRSFIRGITDYSDLHGPWNFIYAAPFYYRTSLGQSVPIPSPDDPQMWLADGVVMREPENPAVLPRILDKNIPIIICNYRCRNLPVPCQLHYRDEQVGQMAAEYFIEKGYKHLAYIGMDSFFWSQGRKFGYQEQVEAGGLNFYDFEQRNQNIEGYSIGEQIIIADWIKNLPKPLALFACNDDRAGQVSEACLFSGISIPEEVAVLGVDNDDLICRLVAPPLSSIALNLRKAGFLAAAHLDLQIHSNTGGGEVIDILPTHVVTRQSTDIIAIEDECVAEAVRFIHENARKPIQVQDVLNAVAVSRRGIYQKFNRILGRSVHQEIRRTRAEEIAKLLLTTTHSISRIALMCGFKNADHIAAYFRAEKKLSPLQYRVRYGVDDISDA